MYKELIPSRALVSKLLENEEFRGIQGVPCVECNSIEDDLYCCTSCWEFSHDANDRIMLAPVIKALHEDSDQTQDMFGSFDREQFLVHWKESDYSEERRICGEFYVGLIAQTDVSDFDPDYDQITDVFFIDLAKLINSLL